MYIKRLALIASLAMALASCQDSFKIEGNTSIAQLEGSKLYLKVFDGTGMASIDSCEVHHGAFSFKGYRDSIEMALISYKDEMLMPVVLDATTINVNMADGEHKASGSALNDSLFRFIDAKSKIDHALAELPNRLSQMIMDGADIDEVQPMLAMEAERIKNDGDRAIIDFIKKNINNPIGSGMFMLATTDNDYPTLTPGVEEILTDAGHSFRNNLYVKKYIEIAEENMLLLREGKQPRHM